MPFVTLLFLRRPVEIVAKFRIAKCLAKSRIVVFINTNEYQNREISISALFCLKTQTKNETRLRISSKHISTSSILDEQFVNDPSYKSNKKLYKSRFSSKSSISAVNRPILHNESRPEYYVS